MTHETTSSTRIAAVVAGILLVTALHLVMPVSLLHRHNAFQHLYHLPIVFAGLTFGWRGGLAAAILAGLSNAPYSFVLWRTLPNYAIDQISEIPLFCAAGILTGVLAERGRKQRADLERTTQRLAEVYQGLQDNFERMKRRRTAVRIGTAFGGPGP